MKTIRPAATAEVIWAYLANEHASKQTLPQVVVARLRLDAATYPEGLAVEEILQAVEGYEVYETTRQLSELCWELRSICIASLGHVHAHVPGAPFPTPVKEAFAGWREYLLRSDAEAQQARGHYNGVLARLRAGEPFRHRPIIRRLGVTVVADGRHRLFAFWEENSAKSDATIEVYWEIPCAPN